LRRITAAEDGKMTLAGFESLRIATPRPGNAPGKMGLLGQFPMTLMHRAHQQAAVAALGQAALNGVEFTMLLEQAAVFMSHTLMLDFAGIYELNAPGKNLRMVAGFGWNNGLIANSVSADFNSMAAYVLRAHEPVIVRDLRRTTEFLVPDFVRSHGVVSSISVVIPGHDGPWGILEAQSRRERSFDEDDFHFLQSIANVISTSHSRRSHEVEREHLAAFVEHNPNPVIELDAEGRMSYCNDAARVTSASLHRKQADELLPPNALEIVRNCLNEGTSALNEQAQIDGRTLSWSFFPVRRIERVHGYAIDITDRLSLEAQLRQSQKMEAIGQLAAGVAHDFNNILTIMQGLTRRLGLAASPEQNEMLGQLFETTERAASLTKQLLAFSRRQVLQRRILLLPEVVANMSRMLQRLIGENITLSVTCADGVPPIEADAAMLEQIILNLAVNARDAMPRGGHLLISTDTFRMGNEPAETSWVRLAVQDTGTGMPAEVKSRIFEPFYTTKEVGKGTGLGLATVFGIVKQHDGFIDVESEVGQGTTFTILFPPSDKVLEVIAAPAADQPVGQGSGETVLLVEDEPILRELAHAILTEAGYRVLGAEQSETARDIWEQHHHEIDLLLTDMVLPGQQTGRELAAELQQNKPNLKVIYTTGYSQDLVEPDCNPMNFLQKPYPPETLIRAVRTCLDA
jgi:two-component system cell cycle sensor histidine kinase/response regulator CckA